MATWCRDYFSLLPSAPLLSPPEESVCTHSAVDVTGLAYLVNIKS